MRVLVATSSEVFGDAGESPQRETSPMRPRSPYGVAKLAAHGLVGAYRRAGLHATSAITFNHESPRRPERFLPRKVDPRGGGDRARALEQELMLGDLDAVRDWSAAQDVVRGQLLAIGREEPDDYVFASGARADGRRPRRRGVRPRRAGPAAHVRVDPAFVRPPEATPPVGDPSQARDGAGLGARDLLRGPDRRHGRRRLDALALRPAEPRARARSALRDGSEHG